MRLADVRILKLGLTNKCNGRCIMCWHSNRNTHGHMELDKRIYQEVKDKLFPTINVLDLIAGGEVFLYSGIDELLLDSIKYNYIIKISTNGTTISEEQKKILSALNVEFTISLDAANAELHNKLRVGCSFDKAIKTIKYFTDNGKKVYIRTCITNHNFYEMSDILELAEELRVAGVKFQTVQYLDAVEKPYKFKKPPEDIEYLKSLRGKFSINFDYFHKSMRYSPIVNIFNKIRAMKKYTYCPNNKNFLKVDIDGKVLSCSMQNASVFGDLNNNSLEDILGRCDPIRKSCICPPMERYLKR